MFKKIFSLISLMMLTLTLMPIQSRGSSVDDPPEYEEVSYEDLLHRISNKKTTLKKETSSPFDDVLIHAGLGYVMSFAQTSIQGENTSEHYAGLQLSLGINLFSPHWYSEAAWRNFGVHKKLTQESSLRELDFKLGYQNQLSPPWTYRLSTGLSTRFMHFSDLSRDLNVDSTTPALLGSFGLMAKMNEVISIGADISYRSPLVPSNDRGSWDMGLQTMASF